MTVITAKQLEFDYQRHIAVFDDDVVVSDPEIQIESDRLVVCFDGTNDVKSVTASGRVRMRTGDKRATCDRAIYLARTGEVVLTGDARLYRGRDHVAGEQITFWVDEDRLRCRPGRLVIFPREGGSGMRPREVLKD